MRGLLDISAALDASRQAAKTADLDLSSVNRALDAIGAIANGSSSVFELCSALDQQIGKAEASGLRQVLIDLRTGLHEKIFAAEMDRLAKLFDQSIDLGWQEWLITVTKAITLFRFDFCLRFFKRPWFLPASVKLEAENLQSTVEFLYQNRWVEAYDELDRLAKHEFISTTDRARLLVILGQIHLYWFWKAGRAKEIFDAADKVAPGDAVVATGLGDYWFAQEKIDVAISCYQRAIAAGPALSNGYVGMGECCERQNHLDDARDWYRKAITADVGDVWGYVKLLKLYGRPELFDEHKNELKPLLARAIAISPEDEYDRYLDLGEIYEQNAQHYEARRLYRKAISLDRTRPHGYVELAKSYARQRREEHALRQYKKAIEVAPRCEAGYWGLAGYCAEQKKWQDALEWYRNTPQHIREWAGSVRAEIARAQANLGNYSEAEGILKRELTSDRYNDKARDVLEQIANQYYEQGKDVVAAERVYAEILQILGETYQGDYHNRIGNLRYFYGEYGKAAEEYRKAIAVVSGNAVFHRNLARALRHQKDYRSSIEELERAFRIDGDEKEHRTYLARLLNAEGNDYYERDDYRTAVNHYIKAIECDPSFNVYYSNLIGAWERLRPEEKSEALDDAIEAFRRAPRSITRHDIGRSDKYQQIFERLYRKKEFASSYGEKAVYWRHEVTPITVEVAGDLISYTSGTADGSLSDEVTRHLTDMRARVHGRYGISIPGVRFRGNETDLPGGTYLVMLMEIPLVSSSIELNKRFFPGSGAALTPLGVFGQPAKNPQTGDEGFWIGQDDWDKLKANNLELWDIIEYPIRHLEAIIQQNLSEFVGHEEVAEMLEREASEELEKLRSSPEKLTAFTNVCRGLIAEQVPLEPFSEIYNRFDPLYTAGTGLQTIVEDIRSSPLFSPRLPGNDRHHKLIPLGPRFEAELSNAIHRGNSVAVLAMEPQSCQDALTAVRNHVESRHHAAIVVNNAEVRPFVRRLIELEFPDIPVLSWRELRHGLKVHKDALIDLEGESSTAIAGFPDLPRGAPADGELQGADMEPTPALLKSSEIAITVFVNRDFTEQPDGQPLADMLSMMRDGLFYELGIVLPEVRIEVDDSLESNEFGFRIGSLEYSRHIGLSQREFLVNDTIDRLRLVNIAAEKKINPANGNECAVVHEETASPDSFTQAGLTTWGRAGFIVLALSAAVRRNASMFQTIEITQYVLDSLETSLPDLGDVAAKRFSVEQIHQVLSNLLDEEISIRDLRGILESLVSISGITDVDLERIVFTAPAEPLYPTTATRELRNLSSSDYSDFVRTCLKRYISHKYSKGSGTVIVYLLDADIEARIRESARLPLT